MTPICSKRGTRPNGKRSSTHEKLSLNIEVVLTVSKVTHRVGKVLSTSLPTQIQSMLNCQVDHSRGSEKDKGRDRDSNQERDKGSDNNQGREKGKERGRGRKKDRGKEKDKEKGKWREGLWSDSCGRARRKQ